MMHVLICDDDLGQRAHIESIVKKTINTEDVQMELILSSGDPTDILEYLKAHPDKRGLYFLDIDLQHHELDGMKLGATIRATDPYAEIIFITTHSELAHLTYEHKLQVTDFIVKGRPEDIETRAVESILTAYKRYLQDVSDAPRYFIINANGEVLRILYDDILFFETSSTARNKIIVHTEYSETDFRGTISEIKDLATEFVQCHKSYIVNINNVSHIDKVARAAVMVNGAHAYISERKMADMIKLFESRT